MESIRGEVGTLRYACFRVISRLSKTRSHGSARTLIYRQTLRCHFSIEKELLSPRVGSGSVGPISEICAYSET